MQDQGRPFMRPRLRIFTGEDVLPYTPPTMTIPLGEFIEILEDALRTRRQWVQDFRDDDVQIPEDLYEVMTEYSRLRPGA